MSFASMVFWAIVVVGFEGTPRTLHAAQEEDGIAQRSAIPGEDPRDHDVGAWGLLGLLGLAGLLGLKGRTPPAGHAKAPAPATTELEAPDGESG